MKSYKYVGPSDLLALIKTVSKGEKILSPDDVLEWFNNFDQILDNENPVIATYIIDLNGNLLIAARHSEHVTGAGGENVLSAGEITFNIESKTVIVTEVTNQSTGYCPEPESWQYVSEVLDKAELKHPESFGREFIFRRCNKCNALNVVKEEWYVCLECNEDLIKSWNISTET